MAADHSYDGVNRSLERGIAILRAFKPGVADLGNAEIAERTGLAKATVSRLTQTLVSGGLLQIDPRRRVYRLAPAVLSLAHAMRLSSPMLSVVAPLMRTEASRRRVNVGLAAADQEMMVYLESFRYHPRLTHRTVVSGQRIPVALTSLGRAYLWALEPSAREREYTHIAKRRPKTYKRLIREIEKSFIELDKLGYCAVGWQPGVVAVATTLPYGAGEPHVMNMSIGSVEPLEEAAHRLAPWLLDLKRRCLNRLEHAATSELS